MRSRLSLPTGRSFSSRKALEGDAGRYRFSSELASPRERQGLPAVAAHDPGPPNPLRSTRDTAPARPLTLAARVRGHPRATARPAYAHVSTPATCPAPAGASACPPATTASPQLNRGRFRRSSRRQPPTSPPVLAPVHASPSKNGGFRLGPAPVHRSTDTPAYAGGAWNTSCRAPPRTLGHQSRITPGPLHGPRLKGPTASPHSLSHLSGEDPEPNAALGPLDAQWHGLGHPKAAPEAKFGPGSPCDPSTSSVSNTSGSAPREARPCRRDQQVYDRTDRRGDQGGPHVLRRS